MTKTNQAMPTPSIRTLVLSVYLPTVLFHIGHGAIIPILPLAARDLGASVVEAGFIVGLGGIGQIAFDVPAGILVGRIGERRAMHVAALTLALAVVFIVNAPNTVVFAIGVVVMGCVTSVWHLARQSYVAEALPPAQMGRAMSALGGMMKVGLFVGAFAGGGVIALAGTDAAFYLCAGLGILAAACLSIFAVEAQAQEAHAFGHEPVGFIGQFRGNAKVFLTAGLGVMAIGLVRSARQVVFPLWADELGFSSAAVSVVFGVSGFIDMALFYPAGMMLDRLGRRFMALSCLTVMALGLLLVPFAKTYPSLLAVGVVMGFGGGLGSGIVMTLGADLSPKVGRAAFLGAWRLVADLGAAGGPFLVSLVTGLASLASSSAAIGATALVGAGVLWSSMPETLPGKATKRGQWLLARDAPDQVEVEVEVI